MNRRGFLGLLAAAAPAALILPELLIQNRTFFLPPSGGWAQPSLADMWLNWAETIRPCGVLMTAAISPLIRRPAIVEHYSRGHVELLVPEETDAELRARMLVAFSKSPQTKFSGATIGDLMPWTLA